MKKQGVVALTRVGRERIDTWVRDGLLKPHGGGAKGADFNFSARDCVEVRLLAALHYFRLRSQVMRAVLAVVRQNWDAVTEGSDVLGLNAFIWITPARPDDQFAPREVSLQHADFVAEEYAAGHAGCVIPIAHYVTEIERATGERVGQPVKLEYSQPVTLKGGQPVYARPQDREQAIGQWLDAIREQADTLRRHADRLSAALRGGAK